MILSQEGHLKDVKYLMRAKAPLAESAGKLIKLLDELIIDLNQPLLELPQKNITELDKKLYALRDDEMVGVETCLFALVFLHLVPALTTIMLSIYSLKRDDILWVFSTEDHSRASSDVHFAIFSVFLVENSRWHEWLAVRSKRFTASLTLQGKGRVIIRG